jgi:hypothetical protein
MPFNLGVRDDPTKADWFQRIQRIQGEGQGEVKIYKSKIPMQISSFE